MSALEAVYICLYFLVAPLVALVFTVQKFRERGYLWKISENRTGSADAIMEAILRKIWFYLYKEFRAAGIRFDLHKGFRGLFDIFEWENNLYNKTFSRRAGIWSRNPIRKTTHI